MITCEEATELILAAKYEKKLTFEAIAKAVGRHKVWVTSALLGQATMNAEEAQKTTELLGLGGHVTQALQQFPMKGSLDTDVPVDPLILKDMILPLPGDKRGRGQLRDTPPPGLIEIVE